MPLKDNDKRREYHNKYMREVWYPKNQKKHIGYVKRLKQTINKYIDNYKSAHNCVMCGFQGSICPKVLDFHHRRDKKFDIASYSRYVLSIKKIDEEISKCELVCANCHRIRTHTKKE